MCVKFTSCVKFELLWMTLMMSSCNASSSFQLIAWKFSVFGVFLVHIFQHLNWIRRYTPYLSVFSPSLGKYRPEKLFTYWLSNTTFIYYAKVLRCFLWIIIFLFHDSYLERETILKFPSLPVDTMISTSWSHVISKGW